VAKGHEWGWRKFLEICFEMVHFGAKVTNTVHYLWFSGASVK